jgi:hypothetical protein
MGCGDEWHCLMAGLSLRRQAAGGQPAMRGRQASRTRLGAAVALARSATPSGVRRATPASPIGFATVRFVVSLGREGRLPGGTLRLASQ